MVRLECDKKQVVDNTLSYLSVRVGAVQLKSTCDNSNHAQPLVFHEIILSHLL